jgi:hypothetical protein
VASVIIALLVWVMDYVFGINANANAFWQGLIGFYYELIK